MLRDHFRKELFIM